MYNVITTKRRHLSAIEHKRSYERQALDANSKPLSACSLASGRQRWDLSDSAEGKILVVTELAHVLHTATV